MKLFPFLILLFSVQFSFAQKYADSEIIVNTSIDLVKARHEEINIFADSLNNYKRGRLPRFLFDECFDLQAGLWEGLHSPVSLRWIVLEKVNNKQALKKILESHDKRLKNKCNYNSQGTYPELVIPLLEKSFYQLIQERYDQLD